MKKTKFFAIVALVVLLCSCNGGHNEDRKPAMLLYMAAANNLDSNIKNNLDDVLDNFVPSENKDLFVFYKGRVLDRKIPRLYRIEKKSGASKAELILVKEYAESLNTASADVLSIVMNDLSAMPTVTIIEDILFSSHATSWLPDSRYAKPLSRGFADDNAYEGTIKIEDMAKVFEQFNLNSILFDACFMGSIEVYYQFRNSANYILASPAEVTYRGMNYNDATKYFTQKMTKESLTAIADITNEMYNALNGWEKSNTFVVTDCSNLVELGSVIKGIVSKYATPENNITAAPMMRYDNSNGYAKDYKEYLYNLIAKFGGNNVSERERLDRVWAKTFVHYCHTDKLLNIINLAGSYGVAGYIYRQDVDPELNEYYLGLDWGRLIEN